MLVGAGYLCNHNFINFYHLQTHFNFLFGHRSILAICAHQRHSNSQLLPMLALSSPARRVHQLVILECKGTGMEGHDTFLFEQTLLLIHPHISFCGTFDKTVESQELLNLV